MDIEAAAIHGFELTANKTQASASRCSARRHEQPGKWFPRNIGGSPPLSATHIVETLMDDTHQNTSGYANGVTNDIAAEAALLGDGTNKGIFTNIDRLKPFQEKVFSVLSTKDQDWALKLLKMSHRAFVMGGSI